MIGKIVLSFTALSTNVSFCLRRPTSLKSGFKKPGKSGMNVFRAVMITGSPGIGKTTSAHLCAKLEGFTPIELNASDARSKKLVEVRTTCHTRYCIPY
jgi:replication factor C subunit 1